MFYEGKITLICSQNYLSSTFIANRKDPTVQSIKNKDLEEILVDSEDDDIRNHREKLSKNFNSENSKL